MFCTKTQRHLEFLKSFCLSYFCFCLILCIHHQLAGFPDFNMKSMINYSNLLGTVGTLILTFAVLMRSLWSGKFRSCAPSKLENTIGSKASQSMGFAKHDAQDFMAFLLDGLHEDLNRVKNKPYIKTEDSDDELDEEIAEVAWQVHKNRNDSFIVELFQGQYKSKLVCPECGKVSTTFDPFMHLSVPLPKKRRVLPVYFFSKKLEESLSDIPWPDSSYTTRPTT